MSAQLFYFEMCAAEKIKKKQEQELRPVADSAIPSNIPFCSCVDIFWFCWSETCAATVQNL